MTSGQTPGQRLGASGKDSSHDYTSRSRLTASVSTSAGSVFLHLFTSLTGVFVLLRDVGMKILAL